MLLVQKSLTKKRFTMPEHIVYISSHDKGGYADLERFLF